MELTNLFPQFHIAVTLSVLAILVGSEFVSNPTEDYPYSLILSRNNYTAYWKHDENTVTLEVHVTTRGWVGVGFSPHGGMQGGDMALAWVSDDGEAHIEDRHALGPGQPLLDDQQDWTLISARETHESTMIKMRRLKNTGDPQDYCLSDETVRLIWAYHPEDPQQSGTDGFQFPYHGHTRRGSKSVWLLSHATQKAEMLEGTFTIDLFNPKVPVPDGDMAYWCQGIRLPPLDEKHHVIKFEAVVEEGHEPLIHHMLLYACHFPVPEEYDGVGDFCYKKNKAAIISGCTGTIFGWPTGGNDFVLPENVGFPIGPGEPTFYRLETHFNFPYKFKGQTVSSGIRLWVTKDLRPHDTGLLESGVLPHKFHLLPPGDTGFRSLGICSKDCLQQAMDASGHETSLHIVATELHTHLKGTAVRVHHVRNDSVIGIIARDNHFDFNFQEMRELPKQVTIKQGDAIVTECVYDTSDQTTMIKGGLSTMDEMCVAHIWYYPKINISNCASMPSPDQTAKAILGPRARAVRTQKVWQDWQLVSPSRYKGRPLMSVLDEIEWNEELRRQFESDVNKGRHLARCDVGSVIYPAGFRFFDFPPVMDKLTLGDEQCSSVINATDSTSALKSPHRHRRRRHTADWEGAGVMGALDMSNFFSGENGKNSSTEGLHGHRVYFIFVSFIQYLFLIIVFG